MDPARFSAVGHGGMPIWNPVGEAALDALLGRLPLPPTPRVLDVGCGPGTLLARLAERRGASGVGVDRSPFAAALARTTTAGLEGRIEIREEAFDASRFARESFDLAACVGSSHAVGDAATAIAALRPLVRPGGLLLLGEGFWERDPDPGYLSFLEARREDHRDFAGTGALGTEAGLVLLESLACSREDWDRYEGEYAANVERFVAEHPSDPDAGAMLERIRPWREGYLRWGRTTLGFGLFVYRRP